MSLVRRVVGKVRREANRRGITVSRQVDVARQAALFDAIKPLDTEHALIRLGGDGDGGYLVPDDLEGIEACFSPGVDVVAGFEEAMIARGIRCFQADASVEQSPLQGHSLVDFEPKFLGITSDSRTMTLDGWVEAKLPERGGDLILQMDIEGAEWLVLAAASDEVLSRFRIILIEFHNVENVLDPFGYSVIGNIFEKLVKRFDVVHAHPNNCRQTVVEGVRYAVPTVMEYSFLRKDRTTKRVPARRFPHPLDRDNRIGAPPVVLPRSLYGPDVASLKS